MDVMAGEVFQRMARIEHTLVKGEIGFDQPVADALADSSLAREVRRTSGDEPVIVEQENAPVGLFPSESAPVVLPEIPQQVARSWILEAVFERLASARSDFLADLRPGR